MSKFVIRSVASGVKFDLKHTNGNTLATSEVYASLDACRNGVASVRRNASIANLEDQTAGAYKRAKHPKFELYADKSGAFRFRLKARNGEIIAVSEEGYSSKASCLGGIVSVKKNAADAEVVKE